MTRKRPQWNRLSRSELERQQALLRAKARDMAERLKQQERAQQRGGADCGLRLMRQHIEDMEQAAQALHHRARSRGS